MYIFTYIYNCIAALLDFFLVDRSTSHTNSYAVWIWVFLKFHHMTFITILPQNIIRQPDSGNKVHPEQSDGSVHCANN